MFVNYVFHQLNNSIYSDLSTLFDYFNVALSHSFDIFAPSITLINRNYSKFSWFNIEFVNLMQLFRRLQRKYASFKYEIDIISNKVFDHFIGKNLYLSNPHTLLKFSVILEYLLYRLINYLLP